MLKYKTTYLKFLFLSILLAGGTHTRSQTITGGMKWKSAAGIDYIYSGEVKNGIPHGRGLAISVGGGDIKIFGDFKNGLVDGNATVFYSNGKVTMGRWKDGSANGPGVAFDMDQTLIYGNYSKGFFEGETTKIFKNSKIVITNLKDSKANGRTIIIDEAGTMLTDIIYINDLANGPGYQYEVEREKKFEGIWENGTWLRASTDNYPSFMRSAGFAGMKTDKQIVMYSAEKNGRPVDTCFTYDRETEIRQFGYFREGYLGSGIRMIADSFYTIAGFNANGNKEGLCVEYYKDHYFSFGNYIDNKLNGNAIFISFRSGDTAVYDGEFKNNQFTGRGAKLTSQNVILTGTFQMNELTDGKKIFRKEEPFGIREITLPAGQKISLYPKDVCVAVNFLVKEYENDFEHINSRKPFIDDKSFQVSYDHAWRSYYSFPDAVYNRILPDKPGLGDTKHNEFTSGLLVTKDLAAIKKVYETLCNKIQACSMTLLQTGKSMKLIQKLRMQEFDEETKRMASLFLVPAYDNRKNTSIVRVMVQKNDNEEYQLTLDIISNWE
jgi:antitoxin component YwqK of YwqJK toxin-antitoxin module